MARNKTSLSKMYQVALMKEQFFDSQMPGLRTLRVRGMHLLTFDVLRNLHKEGKLTSVPENLRLEALKTVIYPPPGTQRVLDDTLIPEIKKVLVGELLEAQVHSVLSDAVDLYGLYASVTLRLGLATDKAPLAFSNAAVVKLRSSDEEDVLAKLMLQKLATGGNVNLYHRLRAFRRSMQSVEDILTELHRREREVKKKTDLMRLSAGRLSSR